MSNATSYGRVGYGDALFLSTKEAWPTTRDMTKISKCKLRCLCGNSSKQNALSLTIFAAWPRPEGPRWAPRQESPVNASAARRQS